MSTSGPEPRHIAYGALVPLPPEAAYAFVCDPRNWPSFFSSLRDADREEGWGTVGSRGRMSNVVLGRTIVSDLEVTVWDPPHEFRYLSRQPGTPPLDNRRVFAPVPGGTRLSGTTDLVPRAGMPGLLDRARLLAVERIFAGAMGRLPEVARSHQAPSPEA